MQLIVRQTTDVDLIVSLHQHCLPDDEFYDHRGNYYWVGSVHGNPACFAMATDIGSSICFLSRCGVLPQFRGCGFQRRLIKIRENFARRMGFNSIITYVTKDNYASLVNLIKCDYELYNPDWQYAGSHNFYLMKNL